AFIYKASRGIKKVGVKPPCFSVCFTATRCFALVLVSVNIGQKKGLEYESFWFAMTKLKLI
ncbi:MAG TPA: hypothetical protein PKL58_08820, partial [Methylophilaceae bacterium]|nr:hypothetical protein [Methylophilaceae bacterium]